MSKTGRKRHSPEQIIKKLRDADALLNSGKAWQRCYRVFRSGRAR